MTIEWIDVSILPPVYCRYDNRSDTLAVWHGKYTGWSQAFYDFDDNTWVMCDGLARVSDITHYAYITPPKEEKISED